MKANPEATSAGRELTGRLQTLGRISDEPDRLVRTFLSPASLQANAQVTEWMQEAGLEVTEDCYGNVTGVRPGPPGSPRVVLGSHLDTVVDAGMYDGPAGIVIAIAAASQLRDPLPFSLQVVAFSDEEGVRFQSTWLGSRGWTGQLTAAELDLRDAHGCRLGDLVEERRKQGYPEPLDQGQAIHAWLEVHIEQGPVLEAADLPLGVVSGIAGQTRIAASFTGKAGHAGTTPMHLRQDALAGAAEFLTRFESWVRSHPPLLGTCGKLEVRPGAGNVIPAEVAFGLDVRHPEDALRKEALKDFAGLGESLARERGLDWNWREVQSVNAVGCDPGLTEALAEVVARQQGEALTLFSGAGHDTVMMATVAPAAMLFLRCREGLSHHPEEFASPGDLECALQATVGFLQQLAAAADA